MQLVVAQGSLLLTKAGEKTAIVPDWNSDTGKLIHQVGGATLAKARQEAAASNVRPGRAFFLAKMGAVCESKYIVDACVQHQTDIAKAIQASLQVCQSEDVHRVALEFLGEGDAVAMAEQLAVAWRWMEGNNSTSIKQVLFVMTDESAFESMSKHFLKIVPQGTLE